MMKAKILAILLLACALPALAYTLIPPPIPQPLEPEISQFYGEVDKAPDGTIIVAQVAGTAIQYITTTLGQEYGVDEVFYVYGTEGDTVQFFINNTLAGSSIFKRYAATKRDLNYPGIGVAGPTCTDGIKNQDETDIDCGGTICPACDRGESCLLDRDCITDNCLNLVCAYPNHCYNGAIDPRETDIDCGKDCEPCDNDKSCESNSDCKSNYCIIVQGAVTKLCKTKPVPQPSSRGGGGGGGASAGWRRFYEEPEEIKVEPDAGMMCTGEWRCGTWGACQPGDAMYRDCTWAAADPTQICNLRPAAPQMVQQCVYVQPVQPTCYDGIQNQGEFGIDCGGPCPPCYIEEVPEPRRVSIWAWLGVPIFLLLIGLAAWLILKPARITDASSYIKSATRRGWSKQEIADKLREAGYTDRQVQQAFRK